ncbi:hypothetical protein ACZ90_38490 [Streptomyces albus subsp. albus]|nr:hypothetical protein ACZ90_38490 [Streptomyces albus subsp. albus]
MASLDASLVVRQANRLFSWRVGGPATDVCGQRLPELMHPAVRRRLTLQLTRLVDGSSDRFAARMPAVQPVDTGATLALSAFAVRGGPLDIAAALVVLWPPDSAPAAERVDPAGPRRHVLTRVDARILEGIAAGQSTLRLASRLHFSRQNIDYRVTGLMRRFEVPNRTALVSRAFSTGMLDAGTWPPKVIEDFVR